MVIFQGKQGAAPSSWRTGIDYKVSPVLTGDGKEIDFQLNLGEGKYYPGGPNCMSNGKLVDCLTYASESGGITGGILVEILKYFNETVVFPHLPSGIIPVLIVDEHQSHLDPKFVEDINHEDHRWKVCLGMPYATTLWQVGDALEQNGMVKQERYREKAKSWFGRMNMAYLMQSVLRMSCQSWTKSFTRHTATLKISKRQLQCIDGIHPA